MSVGFTGSRRGITLDQMETVWALLKHLHGPLHHGDCIGADAEIHDLATEVLGMPVVIHPPFDNKLRAFKSTNEGDEVLEPRDYLERNHDIVDSTPTLIACPEGPEGSYPRSGTWATIRYAIAQRKIVHIVMPSGKGPLVQDHVQRSYHGKA